MTEPGEVSRPAGRPAGADGVPPMVQAGRGLVTAAAGRGVAVRLLGGVAIWIRSSAEARAALGRAYPDVDLVANQRQSRDLRAVLEEQGLEPERMFNATHGARQLQVADVNRKDLSDVAMLLWDHEPGDGDGPGRVNLTRMAKVCGEDWGLYTTVTGNLAACANLLGELVADAGARARIAGRIGAITGALESAPKTISWRMRARVGRRVRWYEVPEEVVR